MPLQIFSWGFWGWGTATKQLISAVDAVETQRGYEPPIFVDIRFRRGGRAPGFRDDAFETLVGRRRYRWMPTLGNASIGTGKALRIACPKAANQLLDLALDGRERGARLIFFCACPSPWDASSCHRHEVARLLRGEARRRRLSIDVREWPGGRPPPSVRHLRVSPEALRRVTGGSKAVTLNRKRISADLAAMPWGTLLMLKAGTDELPVSVGPAAYRSGSWVLPRFEIPDVIAKRDIRSLRRQAGRLRTDLGLD
jgi:hypothetical protein